MVLLDGTSTNALGPAEPSTVEESKVPIITAKRTRASVRDEAAAEEAIAGAAEAGSEEDEEMDELDEDEDEDEDGDEDDELDEDEEDDDDDDESVRAKKTKSTNVGGHGRVKRRNKKQTSRKLWSKSVSIIYSSKSSLNIQVLPDNFIFTTSF